MLGEKTNHVKGYKHHKPSPFSRGVCKRYLLLAIGVAGTGVQRKPVDARRLGERDVRAPLLEGLPGG